MATEEKPVHEQVKDLLDSWNAPVQDGYLALVVGAPVPDGDTRATNSVRSDLLDHNRNPGLDDLDAQRMFADDGDDDEDGDEYDDMNIKDLRKEVDARNDGRDEEDHLSKGGSADDIRARLREDDESDEDEDSDEDDEE